MNLWQYQHHRSSGLCSWRERSVEYYSSYMRYGVDTQGPCWRLRSKLCSSSSCPPILPPSYLSPLSLSCSSSLRSPHRSASVNGAIVERGRRRHLFSRSAALRRFRAPYRNSSLHIASLRRLILHRYVHRDTNTRSKSVPAICWMYSSWTKSITHFPLLLHTQTELVTA